MAKPKKRISKRSVKKWSGILESVVGLFAACNIVAPGLLPVTISSSQALLLLAFLGAATGAQNGKAAQKMLKKIFLSLLHCRAGR